ncbi:MAG TPA: glycerol-3-phosphate 1-O-acyltransferase PlsY [Burkholderiales bacterium]|nr:glycerol-3-phosphate 1-O-acyltransferase PlsY [Burkholderiales bacterium]
MASIVLVVVAYLIGSISFAVIVSRCFGLPDPHTYGSGNPGATNVLRTGRKAAAVLTLIGDAAKGAIALWLARRLAPELEVGEITLAAAAFAAFIGHLFPVYFHFKGGKGVSTAAGILLALDARIAGVVLLVWLLIVVASRFSSLGAIVAALAAPIATVYFLGWGPFACTVLAMTALLLWRHRRNIQRLMNGTESRIRLSRGA